MRILLTIHHHLDINSGAAGATMRLAQAFRSLGHQAEVFSLDDLPQRISERLKPIAFPFYVARKVSRGGTEGAFDVVDACGADGWVCALKRRPNQAPFLVTRSWGLEHRYYREQVEELRRVGRPMSVRARLRQRVFDLPVAALAMRRGDLTLMLNRDDLAYAVGRLGVRSDRARLACGFGLTEALIGRPIENTPGAGSPIGVAVVAAFHERKGINYSVPALNALMKRAPALTAAFIGTGVPQEVVLQRFAPELRPRLNVVSSYRNEDLPKLLSGYQISLLPSLAEGAGISLAEAMACGLAPVATNSQGPREIIEDQIDGLLVPARDAGAIEAAVTRLLSNRALLDSIRRRAYAKAQGYAWTRVAQDTLTLYAEVASPPRRRAA